MVFQAAPMDVLGLLLDFLNSFDNHYTHIHNFQFLGRCLATTHAFWQLLSYEQYLCGPCGFLLVFALLVEWEWSLLAHIGYNHSGDSTENVYQNRVGVPLRRSSSVLAILSSSFQWLFVERGLSQLHCKFSRPKSEYLLIEILEPCAQLHADFDTSQKQDHFQWVALKDTLHFHIPWWVCTQLYMSKRPRWLPTSAVCLQPSLECLSSLQKS